MTKSNKKIADISNGDTPGSSTRMSNARSLPDHPNLKAENPMKAILAAQMKEIHKAFMMTTKHFAEAGNEIRYERMARLLNQLSRTSVLLADGYNRLDNGGRQTIVVKQVTVTDGGQAVVGVVNKRDASDQQSSVTHEKRTPMPVMEGKVGVPLKAEREGDDGE